MHRIHLMPIPNQVRMRLGAVVVGAGRSGDGGAVDLEGIHLAAGEGGGRIQLAPGGVFVMDIVRHLELEKKLRSGRHYHIACGKGGIDRNHLAVPFYARRSDGNAQLIILVKNGLRSLYNDFLHGVGHRSAGQLGPEAEHRGRSEGTVAVGRCPVLGERGAVVGVNAAQGGGVAQMGRAAVAGLRLAGKPTRQVAGEVDIVTGGTREGRHAAGGGELGGGGAGAGFIDKLHRLGFIHGILYRDDIPGFPIEFHGTVGVGGILGQAHFGETVSRDIGRNGYRVRGGHAKPVIFLGAGRQHSGTGHQQGKILFHGFLSFRLKDFIKDGVDGHLVQIAQGAALQQNLRRGHHDRFGLGCDVERFHHGCYSYSVTCVCKPPETLHTKKSRLCGDFFI